VQQAMKQAEITRFAQTFSDQFDALQAEFELFDIKDPIAQLKELIKLFDNPNFGSPALRHALAGLDITTPEGRQKAQEAIEKLFQQLQAGTLTPAELGGLTPQQFLEQLKQIHQLLGGTDAGTGGYNVDRTITEATGSHIAGLLTTGNYFAQRTADATEAIALALRGSSLGGVAGRVPAVLVDRARERRRRDCVHRAGHDRAWGVARGRHRGRAPDRRRDGRRVQHAHGTGAGATRAAPGSESQMTFIVNGVDPSTLGLITESLPGWRTAPSLRRITASVPAAAATSCSTRSRSSLAPPHDQRRGAGRTSPCRTRATTSTRWSRCSRNRSLLVTFNDNSTRAVTCELETFAVTPPPAQHTQSFIPVAITLVAYDPYAYDITSTTVNLAGATALPQGSGPLRPVVTITGASVNPLLTLRNSAGATVATLGITRTQVGGDSLVFDMKARTIKINGVSALGNVISGDFFEVDVAKHGNYRTSSWPTLQSSSGTTAVTLQEGVALTC
jgi:hypothetical protein